VGQQDKCLPKYVRSEFEEYLKCGRLEYGFLRVRCEEWSQEATIIRVFKKLGLSLSLNKVK
jgi:hypothetical protein